MEKIEQLDLHDTSEPITTEDAVSKTMESVPRVSKLYLLKVLIKLTPILPEERPSGVGKERGQEY